MQRNDCTPSEILSLRDSPLAMIQNSREGFLHAFVFPPLRDQILATKLECQEGQGQISASPAGRQDFGGSLCIRV